MIRSFAVSSVTGLAGLALTGPAGAPPPTDQADESTASAAEEAEDVSQGNPEFERKLAELAFALYLGNELNVDAGTYSCTEPAVVAVGETITCFTLIGAERVVVAATELTGTSGVYEFEVLSDHRIDDGEATTTTTTSTTTLPAPFLATTVAPLGPADANLVAFGEQINVTADDLVNNLISGEDGIVQSAEYAWDSAAATVTLSAVLSPTYVGDSDTAAWVIVRDRAMDLWNPQSPFRAEGTTIRPSLDVTIDDVRYVSDHELCIRVADQTIDMAGWLVETRED